MLLVLKSPRQRLKFLICFLIFLSSWALAVLTRPDYVHADVPYVDTPPEVVEAMLDLGEVDSSDVVFDLGSGDGRIVLAAGRRGAVSVGVEIDPELVARSRSSASEQGLSEKVSFVKSDLFEADIVKSDVVFLYLSPRINRELKAKLKSELKPGSRVVSHLFAIDGWEPEKVVFTQSRRLFLYRM